MVGAGVNLVNVHLFVETMPFGGTGSAGLGPTTASMASTRSPHAKLRKFGRLRGRLRFRRNLQARGRGGQPRRRLE